MHTTLLGFYSWKSINEGCGLRPVGVRTFQGIGAGQKWCGSGSSSNFQNGSGSSHLGKTFWRTFSHKNSRNLYFSKTCPFVVKLCWHSYHLFKFQEELCCFLHFSDYFGNEKLKGQLEPEPYFLPRLQQLGLQYPACSACMQIFTHLFVSRQLAGKIVILLHT